MENHSAYIDPHIPFPYMRSTFPKASLFGSEAKRTVSACWTRYVLDVFAGGPRFLSPPSGPSRSALGERRPEVSSGGRSEGQGRVRVPLSQTVIAQQARGNTDLQRAVSRGHLLLASVPSSWRTPAVDVNAYLNFCVCVRILLFCLLQDTSNDPLRWFGVGKRRLEDWELGSVWPSDVRPRRERRMQDAAVCVSHVSVLLPVFLTKSWGWG